MTYTNSINSHNLSYNGRSTFGKLQWCFDSEACARHRFTRRRSWVPTQFRLVAPTDPGYSCNRRRWGESCCRCERRRQQSRCFIDPTTLLARFVQVRHDSVDSVDRFMRTVENYCHQQVRSSFVGRFVGRRRHSHDGRRSEKVWYPKRPDCVHCSSHRNCPVSGSRHSTGRTAVVSRRLVNCCKCFDLSTSIGSLSLQPCCDCVAMTDDRETILVELAQNDLPARIVTLRFRGDLQMMLRGFD